LNTAKEQGVALNRRNLGMKSARRVKPRWEKKENENEGVGDQDEHGEVRIGSEGGAVQSVEVVGFHRRLSDPDVDQRREGLTQATGIGEMTVFERGLLLLTHPGDSGHLLGVQLSRRDVEGINRGKNAVVLGKDIPDPQ
jgi:hypothetical protein